MYGAHGYVIGAEHVQALIVGLVTTDHILHTETIIVQVGILDYTDGLPWQAVAAAADEFHYGGISPEMGRE
jgi:hypothetical protein